MSTEISGVSKYYELSEDTQNLFMGIVKKKSLNEISFQFIGNDSQKMLIKISKLSDQYEFLLKNHILVSINEPLMIKFDAESIDILFEQEINKIHFDMEKNKIKLIKTDINTFSTMIKKWGIEKISRANQLAELNTKFEVSEDLENDFIS